MPRHAVEPLPPTRPRSPELPRIRLGSAVAVAVDASGGGMRGRCGYGDRAGIASPHGMRRVLGEIRLSGADRCDAGFESLLGRRRLSHVASRWARPAVRSRRRPPPRPPRALPLRADGAMPIDTFWASHLRKSASELPALAQQQGCNHFAERRTEGCSFNAVCIFALDLQPTCRIAGGGSQHPWPCHSRSRWSWCRSPQPRPLPSKPRQV